MGKSYRGNNEHARKWAKNRDAFKKQKKQGKKNRGTEIDANQNNTGYYRDDDGY